MKRVHLSAFALVPLMLVACDKKEPQPQPTPLTSASPSPKQAPAAKLDKVGRAEFNRLAAELALPIYWAEDKNKDKALDASELAVTWGLEPGASLADYVGKDGFTPKMTDAYARIVKHQAEDAAAKHADAGTEEARHEAVNKELAQGRLTLVASDFSKDSAEEKRVVGMIMKAAEAVEKLYARQQGTIDLAKSIPEGDLASKMLFFRNQGPKCEGPLTQNDPSCSALPLASTPKGKISGLYPQDLLANPKFCDDLSKKGDKAINDEFTIVTKDDKGALKAVPYNEAFKAEMSAVAGQLRDAANALGEKQPTLREYLQAAAAGFETNNWWPADEAWAKMDAKNSKYYLRIAPDEVYDEPCSRKALFHVSFGVINQGSLKWQQKLDPIKGEMEKALAEMAGAPYKARDVSFKLPDFVDIALNAGDSRKPFGATIGQSLPNFGPVAEGRRGRTVVMTNFYSDPDSVASFKEQAESLFCKDTMEKYTTNPEPQIMSTVLHEAAHNLGPAHQYQVNGKVDRDVFGGPLASTMEELKAQTSALFFTDWLVDKKQVTREEADKAHVRDIFWAFGHISRGMYTEEHHPKNYSQLAAIQLGSLMKSGAIAWKAEETAANGKDKGCFSVATDKMPAAIKTLMTDVAQVKGKGDKPRAEALIKEFVDVTGDKKKVHDVITDRMLRAPKASFVYSVKID